MMKAMIVDDEYYIREGLKKSDLWSELAIEVVGEAEDGAAAWEMYQVYRPDILLLDINIPEINGVELARSIRSVSEDAQIIFLTGYDEFQWVKEAITLQASDYLLKPVLQGELHKALYKANERAKKQGDRNQYVDQLQRQVHTYSKAAHEQWLIDLVQQRRPLAQIIEMLASCGVHLDPAGHYAVLICDIDDFASKNEGVSARDRQLNQYAYRKLAEEALESYEQAYALGETPGRVVLLIGGVKEQSMLLDIAIRLRSVISQYLKLSISIGISNPVQGLEHAYNAYQEAMRAMEYKAIVGGGQIIPYSSMALTVSQNNRLLDKELYMLSEMRAGNDTNVMNILREWSEDMRTMAWSDVKLVASQLVMFVMRLIKEVGLKNKLLLHVSPLVDLYNCRTIDELIRFLTSYFSEVCRAIRVSKEVPSHRMIEQAKEWIREHLSEDLSLVNLADYLKMSPKYLSTRFKQATGETFADFSTQVRFERAKELLADSSLKILDVASKVGFTDTNYFSMAFKKHIGITPTEYRKRFL